MSDSVKISIIIVSFNSWNLLKKCLDSICLSDSIKKEIIIVDNASSDETRDMLKKNYKKNYKFILNDQNIGHPKAVNQGFKAAIGEYILLLDSDTELKKDTIQILIGYLDKNPDVSMISPLTLNSDGTIQMTARNFPSVINGLFGRRSLLTKFFPNNFFSKKYLLNNNYDLKKPFKVDQISAACMFFRKNLLDEVGYFDEKYQGYWVDTDWCKRIKLHKKNIYCIPKAVLYHHEQNKVSQKKHPSRIISFNLGALRLYRLHYTFGWFDPRFLIAACLLVSRMILFLILNSLKSSKKSYKDPLLINEKNNN